MIILLTLLFTSRSPPFLVFVVDFRGDFFSLCNVDPASLSLRFVVLGVFDVDVTTVSQSPFSLLHVMGQNEITSIFLA